MPVEKAIRTSRVSPDRGTRASTELLPVARLLQERPLEQRYHIFLAALLVLATIAIMVAAHARLRAGPTKDSDISRAGHAGNWLAGSPVEENGA